MNAELLQSIPAKLIQISESSDERCSAISVGGVGRSNRINAFKSSAVESTSMNISMSGSANSRTTESRSAAYGCCPGVEFSCFSNEIQGVPNLNIDDLTPLQIYDAKWIDDRDTMSVEFKFWSHKEEITQHTDSQCRQNGQVSGASIFKGDSVAPQEERPSNANRGEEKSVLRSENNSLHRIILSQQQLLQDRFAS